MYDLSTMWHECISFKNMFGSSVKNCKVVRMNVYLKSRRQFLIVVEAMKYLDLQDHMVKTFGSMLLEHIFKPIVEHECMVKKEVNLFSSTPCLEIMIQVNSPSPTYAIILHNCKLVFEYLNENLNSKLSEDINFLSMIGKFIDRKFCKLVFNMSFFDNKDIEKFSSDVVETESFKKYLQELGFIQFEIPSQGENVHEMFDYLKNCTIIEESCCMMHKKIFETVIVKQIFPTRNHYYKSLLNKMGPVSEYDLEKWEMIPNQLRISKSTQDLMDKVSGLLDLAITEDKFECVRLMYTVKNIFGLYAVLLPQECQKLTSNSAHFSAIIYNNCSHFCEWILSLSPKFRDHFPRMSKSNVVTFAQEALSIRSSGTQIFQRYVKSQIAHLTQKIRESELSGKDFSNHEKAVKDSLNTIEILKTSWENLLAYHVYVKTMEEITSSVLKEWTVKILLAGKISSDLALCLRVLIRETITRLKTNFSDDELSIMKYLEKLKAIHVVLEGSTFEIIHEWKKGKGSLATRLKADELKKLIRSIFEADEMVYILNNL